MWRDHQHGQAIAELEQAIAFDPNYVGAYASLADLLSWTGRPQGGRKEVEQAMRLNPHYPAFYLHVLSNAYLLMGQYEEAIAAEQRHLSRSPDYVHSHLNLAIAYSKLGQEEKAREAAAKALRLNPYLSLEVLRQTLPIKDKGQVESIIAALRKAGLE